MIFTGRLHPGMCGIITMCERYNVRATGFLIGYSERYPPFDINQGGADNDAYPPVQLHLPQPPESTPRGAAFNWLLAIPHYFVWAFFAIGAAVLAIIGWFAVLVTRAWPSGMRDWLVRVSDDLVDTSYPEFGLAPT